MTFACDIPPFICFVRSEYLYNLESHYGEVTPCYVYAVDSVMGRATGFEIYTDMGAMFSRLPVSALVHKSEAPAFPLDWLQLWGNFSYSIDVIDHQALGDLRIDVLLKDRKWYSGRYCFTIRWYGSSLADNPGDVGFKTGEMIALDNGCYCIQPRNRIRLFESSFVTTPFPDRPDFKTNSHIWLCETGEKWATEDSDRYFYDIGKIEGDV